MNTNYLSEGMGNIERQGMASDGYYRRPTSPDADAKAKNATPNMKELVKKAERKAEAEKTEMDKIREELVKEMKKRKKLEKRLMKLEKKAAQWNDKRKGSEDKLKKTFKTVRSVLMQFGMRTEGIYVPKLTDLEKELRKKNRKRAAKRG